jgi:hypothetical protein
LGQRCDLREHRVTDLRRARCDDAVTRKVTAMTFGHATSATPNVILYVWTHPAKIADQYIRTAFRSAGTAPAWKLSQRVMPQELFRIRAAAIRMCGVCLVESADTSGEVADHRTARQSLFYLSAAAVTSQSTGRASRSSSAWRTLRPSSCRSVCFWLAKFFKKMTARNCAATQSAKKHRAQAVHGHLPHSHLADGDGECQHVAWSVGGICEFDHIGASFVNDAANTAPLSEDPPVDCAGARRAWRQGIAWVKATF